MADVFISYARSSEVGARRLGTVLREQGYSVWRDDDLPPHRAYGEVIEERLTAAKAVIVVWSQAAVKSQWVRAEADMARQSGKLVQIGLDEAALPLPFNQIHCLAFGGWDGDLTAHAWQKLIGSLDELIAAHRDSSADAAGPSAFRQLLRPEESDRPALRPRLSLVVLPFANLSRDPDQDYFVDGITESLTTDLSRLTGSFVIGRNTAFTYKNKNADVVQTGRELNVRYAIEGSVQRGGERLRLNVQLVDTQTGAAIWSDRFDKPIADLFEMQDEIVTRLARELDVQLIAAEARRMDGHELDAIDHYFRGQSIVNEGFSPQCALRAREVFLKAHTIDPDNADTLAALAQYDGLALALAYSPDGEVISYRQAEAFAKRAIALSPNHAMAHLALGQVFAFTGRIDESIAEYRRSLTLDRNLAHAHSGIAASHMYAGNGQLSEASIRTAFQLSPHDHQGHLWCLIAGAANLLIGQAEAAETWFRRGLEINRAHPILAFYLAAALMMQGRTEESRQKCAEAMAQAPQFSIAGLRAVRQSRQPTYVKQLEVLIETLRQAGVPEEAALQG